VDEETIKLGVNATPQFIGALTELVWVQIGMTPSPCHLPAIYSMWIAPYRGEYLEVRCTTYDTTALLEFKCHFIMPDAAKFWIVADTMEQKPRVKI
jgi:hypothetical protein